MTGEPLPFDPIAEARRQWEEHGWGDVAQNMAAVTSIMRVQQLLLARIDAVLKPFDVSFARYEVLMLLTFARRGSLTMSRIGSVLQVHPASVTSAVERLEKQGFVTRERRESDRRTVRCSITEAGSDVARRATAAMNEQVFAGLFENDADAESLVAVLRDFRRRAGDF